MAQLSVRQKRTKSTKYDSEVKRSQISPYGRQVYENIHNPSSNYLYSSCKMVFGNSKPSQRNLKTKDLPLLIPFASKLPTVRNKLTKVYADQIYLQENIVFKIWALRSLPTITWTSLIGIELCQISLIKISNFYFLLAFLTIRS